MNNVTQIPAYDFTSTQLTDAQKMGLVVKFQRNTREAGAGMAGWVHGMGVKFNITPNLLTGPQNAGKFKNYITDLIQQVTTKQQEYVGYALDKDDLKDLQLTGSSSLAVAFKKVFGTMERGGDLKLYDTVSKCQKFISEQRIDEEKKGRTGKLREAAKAQALTEGLVEGSTEFEQRVNTIVGSLEAIDNSSSEKANTTPENLDEVDTVLKRISAKVHSLMSHTTLDDLLADLSKYEEKIDGRINHFLAKSGGLLKTA